MNGAEWSEAALWSLVAFVSAAALALALATSSLDWASAAGFVFGLLAGGAAGLAKGSAQGRAEADAARTADAAAVRRFTVARRDGESS